jgi:hypothetical protein
MTKEEIFDKTDDRAQFYFSKQGNLFYLKSKEDRFVLFEVKDEEQAEALVNFLRSLRK